MPTYARYSIALDRGEGAYVFDTDGKRYLDACGGIAVNSLGHCHPAVTEAVREQAGTLMHVSNLYYIEKQGELAERLCAHFDAPSGGGKVFFCNSGAEANEGMFKLARLRGRSEKRHKIVTAVNSFHGRTLGGLSATGQDKIKDGFHPMVQGMGLHVPFNDIEAMAAAVDDETAAVMIEGVQGEGGIVGADPDYLLGLRRLCDDRGCLLLFDAVQCGHFRTGRFQSYQRILEGVEGADRFAPDAVSMAKSLGGGMPIGAVWAADEHADVLCAGKHGTTFGGGPLACAAALAVLDVVEAEGLADNARARGEQLAAGIARIAARSGALVKGPRGLGLMVGVELDPAAGGAESTVDTAVPGLRMAREGTVAGLVVGRLMQAGMLAVPAGERVVRLLPPLNWTEADAEACLDILDGVCADLCATEEQKAA
jgi:acetylornithine aminotransferase/acetylornithine/N-succinyldiaminopimelate aminotransferase